MTRPAATSALLDWYDRHRRDLPWRAKPGERPDPYRVWLSEIMLQQTTVASVKPYFAKFLALWPAVEALAAADDRTVLAAWAGLGYYARARNLIACARAVSAAGGRFPETEAELRALPGVGAYTAAAIAAIAFNEPATVIDGNVERVVTRLFAIETPMPAAKAAVRAALTPLVPRERPGDFAQAMMDLGAGLCAPRSPACRECPLSALCEAHRAGRPVDFPVKAPKKARPVRHGIAYVARRVDGSLLLATRPGRGLLAGMAEVPNSAWCEGEAPRSSPPVQGDWKRLNRAVVHVFTHFELRLTVAVAPVGNASAPPGMRWVKPDAIGSEPLPTLFRKVIEVAGQALSDLRLP